MTNFARLGQLGILCVNFNSAELIEQNLAGLGPQNSRVYVADNFSTGAALDRIAAVCQRQGFHLLSLGKNLGFGEATNRLAELAIRDGCTHLLLQNPDATIESPAIDTMMRISAVHPESIIGPTITNEDGALWFEAGYLDLLGGNANHGLWTENLEWITAACLLVPVPVWKQLGGFSKGYFLCWEDVDLTFRWRMGGGDLLVLQVRATHVVGATQQSAGLKSPLYAYFNARNRMLFAGKNLGVRDLLRWFGERKSYRRQLLLRLGEADRGTIRQYNHAANRGSWAGLAKGVIAWMRRKITKKESRARPAAIQDSVSDVRLETWPAEITEAVNQRPRLFAFPYYSDNPWQAILYSSLLQDTTFELIPLHAIPVLPHHSRLLPGDVLHINWTAPISQAADSSETAFLRVEDTLRRIDDAKKHGVRILWTIHNILPHELVFPEAEIALLRGLSDLADLIMIMNPGTAELVQPYYRLPAAKIWVLPHSSYMGVVPPPPDRYLARASLGLFERAPTLLCFGQLRPYKNVDRVIREFRKLDDPEARLIIAGSPSAGVTTGQLEELCGDDGRILLLLERINDEKVASLFAAADLLVQAYSSGLNSGAAALSASYGCPVAVSISPETEALRSELWVTGIDFDGTIPEADATLHQALEWARTDSNRLRSAAADWAAKTSPQHTAREFADKVVCLSRGKPYSADSPVRL